MHRSKLAGPQPFGEFGDNPLAASRTLSKAILFARDRLMLD
jgi:hypothetical protein